MAKLRKTADDDIPLAQTNKFKNSFLLCAVNNCVYCLTFSLQFADYSSRMFHYCILLFVFAFLCVLFHAVTLDCLYIQLQTFL